MSFPFGELDVNDTQLINGICKQVGILVDTSVTEGLKGAEPQVTKPEPYGGKPDSGPAKPSESKDATQLGWKDTVMCKGCQSTIQVHMGKTTGKPWAVCKKCGCWLNSDGSLGEKAPPNLLK